MTLANYVKLAPEVEKILSIKDGSFRVEERLIPDVETQKEKTLRVAVVDVIEEDRVPVTKTFSITSEKLATTFKTMHDNGDLYKYPIGITKRGTGFTTEYTVRLL